ncbi:Pumilio [Salix suchowensis]|nr:Pumilio [Salix suchowensis]
MMDSVLVIAQTHVGKLDILVFLKAPSLFPCLSPSSDCVDRGFSEDKMEEIEKGSKGVSEERWKGAVVNLTEMTSNLDSLQKLLLKKAVFVDDETFSKASLTSEQSRTIKVLEQRVQTLERELDAAISAAAHARAEKRQAEAAQKAAELRAQEITRELENTTKVFELHLEELHSKQDEISKRDTDIKLLEAIIQTLGGKESRSSNGQ